MSSFNAIILVKVSSKVNTLINQANRSSSVVGPHRWATNAKSKGRVGISFPFLPLLTSFHILQRERHIRFNRNRTRIHIRSVQISPSQSYSQSHIGACLADITMTECCTPQTAMQAYLAIQARAMHSTVHIVPSTFQGHLHAIPSDLRNNQDYCLQTVSMVSLSQSQIKNLDWSKQTGVRRLHQMHATDVEQRPSVRLSQCERITMALSFGQ